MVDDEKVVADTFVEILKMNGFYAVARYSGITAIEQAKIEPFDLLFTDVVMSGMNGIETAREICKIHPECQVILVPSFFRVIPGTSAIFPLFPRDSCN